MSEVQEVETEQKVDDRPDCIFCLTVMGWMEEAWPSDSSVAMPIFTPRKAADVLKISGEGEADKADFMPFCQVCAGVYMRLIAQFQQERQARGEGGSMSAKAVVAPPPKQILTPGMPGFRKP